jgi:tetraacyldisaccharide 4'-kinase
MLMPAAALYGAAIALRNELYDSGTLKPMRAPVPVLSVGNLTAGGTGKTPVSAWFARQLKDRGMQPAVLMRGYGEDEALVHKRLNPEVPVLAGADRVASARTAAGTGASVLVLDDGFQHRRLFRDVDVVLIGADGFAARPRLLPAGPLREPLSSLARASLVVVTNKAADAAAVRATMDSISSAAPRVPVAQLRLGLTELHTRRSSAPRASLKGRAVLAISAIANPSAFHAQLRNEGAQLVEAATWPDHHEFTSREVDGLRRRAAAADMAVCTLKDFVKLDKQWPDDTSPLWYVSQSVEIEHGVEVVNLMLDSLISPKHEQQPAQRGARPTHWINGN